MIVSERCQELGRNHEIPGLPKRNLRLSKWPRDQFVAYSSLRCAKDLSDHRTELKITRNALRRKSPHWTRPAWEYTGAP